MASSPGKVNNNASSGTVEEFNTNLGDKDERKKVRKMRIDRRYATETSNNDEVSESVTGSNKTGSSQVTESLFHLDKRKISGLQHVTDIRVRVDDTESKRRLEDDFLRRERLEKLQEEALTSAKANAAVEMKWAEILDREIPQELNSEIQVQMNACKDIIKSKDDLIKEFQRQLRAKDEEYVRALRQQAEDIEELLSRIRSEFKEMQGEYEKELEAIEEAYLDERDRMASEHAADVEAIFDLRRNKEAHYKESKQKREEQYQREADDLITKGADQYNKLKIELELNIQTLKQQLEEIRATYQLNTEKLDYNFRVLTELDKEKSDELVRYKRRLAKLKEQLSQMVTKYTEMDATDSKRNNELTEDYRSLTQKYKDLQLKFRHFEVADTSKYEDVWVMHEDEAKDLLDQLLKADKVITEQQLGLKWVAPDPQALQAILGRHGTLSATVAAATMNTSATVGVQQDSSTGTDGEAVVLGLSVSNQNDGPKKIAGTRIRAVLRMLATEAGFILDSQLLQTIESLPDGDAELSRAEAILKALGVKSEEKLNALVEYFFVDNVHGLGISSNKLDGDLYDEEDDSELRLHHPSVLPEEVRDLKAMIRPEDVIAAVQGYIEDSLVDGPLGVTAVAGGRAREEEERVNAKRLAAIKTHWVNLSQVVSDDSVEVWRQLENNAVEMKDMLAKRAAAIAEVDDLAARNVELKKLLNHYLSDRTMNISLQIPPAQVMKVRELGHTKTSKNYKNTGGSNDHNSSLLMSTTVGGTVARVGRQHAARGQEQRVKGAPSAEGGGSKSGGVGVHGTAALRQTN